MNGVPQDPLDYGHPTSPSHHDLCDTHQPACTSAILFGEQGVSCSLDAASEYSTVKRMHSQLSRM